MEALFFYFDYTYSLGRRCTALILAANTISVVSTRHAFLNRLKKEDHVRTAAPSRSIHATNGIFVSANFFKPANPSNLLSYLSSDIRHEFLLPTSSRVRSVGTVRRLSAEANSVVRMALNLAISALLHFRKHPFC